MVLYFFVPGFTSDAPSRVCNQYCTQAVDRYIPVEFLPLVPQLQFYNMQLYSNIKFSQCKVNRWFISNIKNLIGSIKAIIYYSCGNHQIFSCRKILRGRFEPATCGYLMFTATAVYLGTTGTNTALLALPPYIPLQTVALMAHFLPRLFFSRFFSSLPFQFNNFQ